MIERREYTVVVKDLKQMSQSQQREGKWAHNRRSGFDTMQDLRRRAARRRTNRRLEQAIRTNNDLLKMGLFYQINHFK